MRNSDTKAASPEEICRLFKQYMGEGNLESVLSMYDPEAVFVKQSGEVTNGREALREQLIPLAARKARFDYTTRLIVEAGDVALQHTDWTIDGPEPLHVHAIEVARRQRDGSWRWLIGDPFTVGRTAAGTPSD